MPGTVLGADWVHGPSGGGYEEGAGHQAVKHAQGTGAWVKRVLSLMDGTRQRSVTHSLHAVCCC
jgi:hypothetical protein